MDTLDVEPWEKARLQEVADGMLKIYRTMARMRYLDPEWIEEGPHDISDKIDLYRGDDLEDTLIYLYSILPYVEAYGAASLDFFERGEFEDNRQGSRRDPSYSDEANDYLRPWMTALSAMGNEATWLVYSAKHHCIWVRDMYCCGGAAGPEVSDPGDPENWVPSDGEEDEDEEGDDDEDEEAGDGSEGSQGGGEEEAGDDGSQGEVDDEEVGNEEDDCEEYNNAEENDEEENDEDDDEGNGDDDYAYQLSDARPAPKLLNDIDRWYQSLKTLPGYGEHSEGIWTSTRDVVRALYTKHGWPSADFDGDGFLTDMARAHAVDTVSSDMNYKSYPIFARWEALIEQKRKRDGEEPTESDEWLERFHSWKQSLNEKQRRRARIPREEANKYVWDEHSAHRRHIAQKEVDTLQDMLNSTKDHRVDLEKLRTAPQYDFDTPHSIRLRLKQNQQDMDMYARAHAAAQEDAQGPDPARAFIDRISEDWPWPGGTVDAMLKEALQLARDAAGDVEEARAWIGKLPAEAEAEKARKAAGEFLEGMERCVNEAREFAKSWGGFEVEEAA